MRARRPAGRASPARAALPLAAPTLAAPTLAALALAACRGPQSALEPGGPAAARIATLWWVMLAIGTVVTLIVSGLFLYAAFHRRRARAPGDAAPPAQRADEGEPDIRADPRTDRRAVRWILLGGGVAPVAILLVLFVYILSTLGALATSARAPDLIVEVTGHQWWWDVRYAFPELSQRFTTANEIHIPTGRRVHVRLRSNDVIHSFWVPRLQGKLDLIPGKMNETWIQADAPGVYRGQCAEFCGLQHAKMALLVVAQPPEEFAAWAAAQREPAAEPTDSLARVGRELVVRGPCGLCHAIRGTTALARVAPDLTHIAGRRTLAAGALPNTRGWLGGWVSDPQSHKPGTRMPHIPLSADEFRAILAYLETLR